MGFKTDILQVEEIISDSTIVLETLTTEGTTVTLNNIDAPTDVNASGGGLTLKGDTDKTILWDDTNDNWTSNQHLNIATGLDYKVNNVSVLNATTLGSSVVNSSLTSLGTITSLVATTADINGGTIDGATIGGSTAGAITGTTITANTGIVPDANDGAYLGTTALSFSDLFLASGGVINFANSDYTITHSTGNLTLSGTLAANGNVTITTADNPQITLTDSTAVTSGTVKYNSTTESIDFIFS